MKVLYLQNPNPKCVCVCVLTVLSDPMAAPLYYSSSLERGENLSVSIARELHRQTLFTVLQCNFTAINPHHGGGWGQRVQDGRSWRVKKWAQSMHPFLSIPLSLTAITTSVFLWLAPRDTTTKIHWKVHLNSWNLKHSQKHFLTLSFSISQPPQHIQTLKRSPTNFSSSTHRVLCSFISASPHGLSAPIASSQEVIMTGTL